MCFMVLSFLERSRQGELVSLLSVIVVRDGPQRRTLPLSSLVTLDPRVF